MTKIDSAMKMKGMAVVLAVLLAGCAADGSDANTVLGGAIGGGAGAAIGQEIGGRNGAIIGGAIGGATGAAVGNGQNAVRTAPAPAERNDDEDGYRNRRDNGRHNGERRDSEEEDD